MKRFTTWANAFLRLIAGSTILNKLKEQNSEYEYLFEQMKAEKKKFKIRKGSL